MHPVMPVPAGHLAVFDGNPATAWPLAIPAQSLADFVAFGASDAGMTLHPQT